MSKLQRIFNTVIDTGFYINQEKDESSFFMCHSLLYALMNNWITEDERDYAIKKIHRYMNKLAPSVSNNKPLSTCLYHHQLPHAFEDTLSIYKDWKNRPKPWKTINLLIHFPYQE